MSNSRNRRNLEPAMGETRKRLWRSFIRGGAPRGKKKKRGELSSGKQGPQVTTPSQNSGCGEKEKFHCRLLKGLPDSQKHSRRGNGKEKNPGRPDVENLFSWRQERCSKKAGRLKQIPQFKSRHGPAEGLRQMEKGFEKAKRKKVS